VEEATQEQSYLPARENFYVNNYGMQKINALSVERKDIFHTDVQIDIEE